MTAPPAIPSSVVVDVPAEELKKAEERLAHFHPEHHHFYETKHHVAKRIFTIAVAGTGFLADSVRAHGRAH